MEFLILHAAVTTFRHWLRGNWIARLAMFNYLGSVATYATWNIANDLGQHRAVPFALVLTWIVTGIPKYRQPRRDRNTEYPVVMTMPDAGRTRAYVAIGR